MGARSYTVDALGEVKAYTDAKSQSFSFVYDLLSRPTTRTEPDMKTTWTWGDAAGSYNIGKLQEVSAVAAGTTYSEGYTYDSLTRLSVKTITIPGDASYSYTSTYNATTGLLASLAYPALTTPAYQLKLNYTVVNGYLQSIVDAASGVKYWTANTINPRGQVTEATLGNGLIINRGFDAVTGWMSTSQAGLAGGTGLQNLSYIFDEVGNLKTRQDLNQALTEGFNYDPVYRLLNSTLGGVTNLTMTYDVMGDITSRSDVNAGVTWTYDPVHKHQVTSAGTGFGFSYDANGNMLTGRGGTMSWYSYNLPNVITNPYGSTQFFYGPDHQYYKQIEGGGSKTTLYIGGLLEKVSVPGGYTEYRHKIQTDGAMIEIDKTTGTNSNIYYVTQDHLGSSAVITNSAGVQQVSESFNAWGSRRGSNWQGSPSTADNTAIANTTSDGFTGHTMLDSVKMIHMNGRVYDRVIGRFISADPTMSEPGNTQTWNRYSYANNNPLTFVDPSGFECVDVASGRVIPCSNGTTDNPDAPPEQTPEDTQKGLTVYENPDGSPAEIVGNAPRDSSPPTGTLGGLQSGNTSNSSSDGAGSSARSSQKTHNSTPETEPSTTLDPCAGAGHALSPLEYAARGRQTVQIQAYLNSVDDGSGGAAAAGELLSAVDLLSFWRGASLDAQASGGSRAYGNYAYGSYMAGADYSLSTALWGANAFAVVSLAKYPPGVKTTPKYPSIPNDNVANVVEGYAAQQSNSLCTPHH